MVWERMVVSERRNIFSKGTDKSAGLPVNKTGHLVHALLHLVGAQEEA